MQLMSDTEIYSVFVVGTDLDDDTSDIEERWNAWVERWFAFGYEPAEEPVSSDEATMTFRMIPLDDDE